MSLSSAGLEPLDVPLELLVPPLGFVSAALGVPQGGLQRGHTPVVLGQGGLELRHFGSQLRVLLLQPARHVSITVSICSQFTPVKVGFYQTKGSRNGGVSQAGIFKYPPTRDELSQNGFHFQRD